MQVRHKHVYITGGGGGTGLALMRRLVPLGANVSFVTKDLVRGAELVEELKTHRLDPQTQKIVAVSADLSDHTESEKALQDAMGAQDGQAPDWVFLTAGFAWPSSFLNDDPQQMMKGMNGIYWVHAWTAQIVASTMKKQNKIGNIVFVSNYLSVKSYTGYSAYAPAKYAIKGLYDTLVSELEPDGIKVWLFLLSGQCGGNYDKEQERKCKRTRKLDTEHGYAKLDEDTEAGKIIDGIEHSRDGLV